MGHLSHLLIALAVRRSGWPVDPAFVRCREGSTDGSNDPSYGQLRKRTGWEPVPQLRVLPFVALDGVCGWVKM